MELARTDDRNRFCNQDEEHDPGEDFEEWLTCLVCGDHCTFDPYDGAEQKSLALRPNCFRILANSASQQLIGNALVNRNHSMTLRVRNHITTKSPLTPSTNPTY